MFQYTLLFYLCSFLFGSLGAVQVGTNTCYLFPADESAREHIKMASQEESVREFVAVTDVDEERARFFLESAGWNLQVRLFRVCRWGCVGLWSEGRRESGNDTTAFA